MRKSTQSRVRQPLSGLAVVSSDATFVDDLKRFADHIREELNVKKLEFRSGVDDLAQIRLVPQLGILGPKYRSDATRVVEALGKLDPRAVAGSFERGEPAKVTVGDRDYAITAEEVTVVREMPEDLVSTQACGATFILDTHVTPELRAEGLARDTVRHVQRLRKESGFEIDDRIHLSYATEDAVLSEALSTWRDYIMSETLACEMTAQIAQGPHKSVTIGGAELRLHVAKATDTRV